MSSLQKKTPACEAGAEGENKKEAVEGLSLLQGAGLRPAPSLSLGEALVEDLLCGLSKKGEAR